MNPPDDFRKRSADDDIECTAADWLGRQDGGLTTAESDEFNAWINADLLHAAAFAELEAACRSLDRLASFRPANTSRPDPNLPLLPPKPAARPAHHRTRAWLPFAAAAAVIFLAYISPPTSFVSPRPQFDQVSTGVGDFRRSTLPDGSVLELNTDSKVEIVFSSSDRRVKLIRGEVYFAVAKDASRPFIVTANGVDVRAVGTAFNIRLRGEAVDVLVTEGRIRVKDASTNDSRPSSPTSGPETTDVAAGERVLIQTDLSVTRSVSPSVQVQTVNREEMGRLLAWQDKRLEFGPTPLRDIVAEFNRYNRQQLVVANDETGALSVGGTFSAKDPDTFVHLLQSSFGISSEKRGRQTVLRRLP